MKLTSERGEKIRKEYSEIKEKLICDDMGLLQIGGSKTKVDGSDGIKNVSIKNFTGQSTQVHLTTQKRFIQVLNLDEVSKKFIELFCGNPNLNFNGQDRYYITEIETQYVEGFLNFLTENKNKVIDLMVRNNFEVTAIIYKNLKTGKVSEISYEDVMKKINDCSWVPKKGGIHLKDKKGKTYFHIQREGKKNKNNRYNVLCHVHSHLFSID